MIDEYVYAALHNQDISPRYCLLARLQSTAVAKTWLMTNIMFPNANDNRIRSKLKRNQFYITMKKSLATTIIQFMSAGSDQALSALLLEYVQLKCTLNSRCPQALKYNSWYNWRIYNYKTHTKILRKCECVHCNLKLNAISQHLDLLFALNNYWINFFERVMELWKAV